MSNLNSKGVSTRAVGVSYNGNPQDVKKAEQQLYELAVSALFSKDTYYEDSAEGLTRLATALTEVVRKGNLDFVANTIIHARTVMNIRSMPIVLTAMFASVLRSEGKVYPQLRNVVCDVIQRADQISDMYAVALQMFGNKKAIPMAIKRGVADAFNKFDEYSFGKYNSSKAVKLRDVLRIVHPTAKNNEQGLLFEKVIKDTVATPYTWETQLSANGQLPEAERKSKKQLWTELVASGELGYMALLRNLRNISEAVLDPITMEAVYARISSSEEVAKSKQLPFRFVSALEAAGGGNSKLTRAIHRAIDASLSNLPKVGDNLWIIVDASGSMEGRPYDTAAMFAAALAKANAEATNVKVTIFSDNAKHVTLNTDNSVMSMVEQMQKEIYGGGTNLQAALDKKAELGFEPDTVVLFSDMQVNSLGGGSWRRVSTGRTDVSKLFTPSTVKVAVNLNAYDTTPVSEIDGWYQLSGWSERLFDFIPAMRNKQSVVKTLSVPYLGVRGIKNLAK